MACWVTMRCLARVGSAWRVACAGGIPARVLVDERRGGMAHGAFMSGIGCTLVMAGSCPGVLFRVTRLWIRGVDLSARLEVGLRACMIGGASVSRGTVIMGDSSITLCFSALTLCSFSLTLCCACGVAADAGGVRMFLIVICNFLMSARPLAVVPVLFVTSASSSVSARKCWCCVKFGT